jgi:hypothetical protein
VTPTQEQVARWRSSVPPELHALPLWLVWVKRPRHGKPGKFDKIPHYADGWTRSGEQGSTEDRHRLVTLPRAIGAYEKEQRFAGIGVAVLPDAPFWALDLDDCRDDVTGELTNGAKRCANAGSYAEVSPSGRGVRVLFVGKIGVNAKNHAAGVEAFDSKGFVTLTGNRLAGRELAPCPAELLDSLRLILGRRKKSIPHEVQTSAAPAEQPELIRGLKLPRALWLRLRNPYADYKSGKPCDRSAEALSIAIALKKAGITEQQALEVLCRRDGEAFAPALERRDGDIDGARDWMWRYVVVPAYGTENGM